MDIQEQKAIALDMIKEQRKELPGFYRLTKETGKTDLAFERLERWKERTVNLLEEHVSPLEAQKLTEKEVGLYLGGDPKHKLSAEINMYDVFLSALVDSIKKHPKEIFSSPVADDESPEELIPEPASSDCVFIIHGHDMTNLLKLQKLLRERWELDFIVMAEEPGKGRTLIEKFEEEAIKSVFALALMTPDDFVNIEGEEYGQARPNVIFELGWFYANLGRDRVCILIQEDAKLHSDLDGISKIKFRDSIDEKVIEIEDELIAAKVLRK